MFFRQLVLTIFISFIGTASIAECGGWSDPSVFNPSPPSFKNDANAHLWITYDFFNEATADDINRCLSKGYDPLWMDSSGATPLHVVANVNRDPTVIQALINAGSDLDAVWRHKAYWINQTDGIEKLTPLAIALLSSDLDIVFRLIGAGASLDFEKTTGLSSLFYPTGVFTDDRYSNEERTNAKLLDLLMAQNPDLEVRNRFGQTPLQRALERHNEDYTRALIEAGADVSAVEAEGPQNYALHIAAEEQPSFIKLLVSKGADINARNPRGDTALHLTGRRGVEALVELGADVNVRNGAGKTPLHLATARLETETIVTLLNYGAGIDARDKFGNTPAMVAAYKLRSAADSMRSDLDIRLQIINEVRAAKGWDLIPFEQFLSENYPQGGNSRGAKINVPQGVLSELILSGADLSIKNNDDLNPVNFLRNEVNSGKKFIAETSSYLAATQGCDLWHREPKRLINLMFAGMTGSGLERCIHSGVVSVETSPRPGMTILEIASSRTGDITVFEALERNGANFQDRYRNGNSVLHNHARSRFADRRVLSFLMERGLAVDVRNEKGQTPLHNAAGARVLKGLKPPTIAFLLDAGADPMATDQNKWTPLHWALNGTIPHSEMRRLVEAGADVDAKDSDGMTPLHLAVKFRAERTIDLADIETLLDLGADPRITDNTGNTPLDFAIELQSVENEALALLRTATTAPIVVKKEDTRAAAVWGSVKKSNDPLILEMFIDSFPDSSFADEARVILQPEQPSGRDALMWKALEASTDALTIQAFLDTFPYSVFAPDARARLKELNPASDINSLEKQAMENHGSPGQCDRLAAHPGDLGRTTDGVPMADLETDPRAAIAACLDVVDADATGRIAFQLSRAYFAAKDNANRELWLDRAKELGWERAQYRWGLLTIDNKDASATNLHAAVDILEALGDAYPFGYLDAGHTLRHQLEGPNVHKTRIVKLFELAAKRDQTDAYMQLASMAHDRHIDVSPIEMINMLTHLIDQDHKTEWAKDILANYIYGLLGKYEEKSWPRLGAVQVAVGVGLGADQNISETEMLMMIEWALEAIASSENVKRLSNETRFDTLRELIYRYAAVFPPPDLRLGMTNEQARKLRAESDPRLRKIMDTLCVLMRKDSPANISQQLQAACDTFRRNFQEEVYSPLIEHHLSRLEFLSNMQEISAFQNVSSVEDIDLSRCLAMGQPKPDGRRVFVSVRNECPLPIKAYLTLSSLQSKSVKSVETQGVLAAGETKIFKAGPAGGRSHEYTRVTGWACHAKHFRNVRDTHSRKCSLDAVTYRGGPLGGFLEALSWSNIKSEFAAEMVQIFEGAGISLAEGTIRNPAAATQADSGTWTGLLVATNGQFFVGSANVEAMARTVIHAKCGGSGSGDCSGADVVVEKDWFIVGYFCRRDTKSSPFVAASKHDYFTARLNASKKIEANGFSIVDDCNLVHRIDPQ